MQTQILERDAGRTKVQIDIPASDVSKAYQQVLGSIARQIRVPGFRPGKAPRGVIETRVGKDAIAQEVRDALVQTYLPRAVSELSLTPVSQHLHAHEPVDGQDYSFEAVLELYPDFSLPDFAQIVFDTEQPPVTDDLMEAEVAGLRRQYATLIPVERAAAEGDYLTVETVPTVAGEEGSSIPVDLENVTPELAAQFVGRSIGEEIELTLSEADEEAAVEGVLDELAEAYGEETVAEVLTEALEADEASEAEVSGDEGSTPEGKAASAEEGAETDETAEPSTLRVVLRDVREKELPEADDEFAKTLGMDTWAEVEAQVRRGLETRLAQEALAAQQEEFTEKLLLETVVAVPPSLKARRKSSLLQNLSRDLEGRNLTLQGYLESLDAEEGKRAEFEGELDETAEAAVKRDLVLERVLEARGTTLPDAEFEAALAYTARRQNTTPQALKRELGENGLTNYRFLLTRDKAVRETVEELVRAQNGTSTSEQPGSQAATPTPVQTAEPSATDPVQSEE